MTIQSHPLTAPELGAYIDCIHEPHYGGAVTTWSSHFNYTYGVVTLGPDWRYHTQLFSRSSVANDLKTGELYYASEFGGH